MKILGIETSCDETAVAIYDDQSGLLSHALYSQSSLHELYGGVIPELASRDHLKKIIPLLENTLVSAKIKKEKIDAIAYTAGPGLIGALMIGSAVAHAIGFALKIPLIPVNHLEGHLLSPFIETDNAVFPFLALLASGGHTQLIEAHELRNYQLLGETLDDSVGEAFDKTAKILGLPYPGGAKLSKLATKGRANRFKFPRPMTTKPNLDFSFSGLKTHALNCFESSDKSDQTKADIAYAFEDAATDTLIIKCQKALKKTGHHRLVVAGGVSANLTLRKKLDFLGSKLNLKIYYPSAEFCTDNGAMIAYAGFKNFSPPNYHTTSAIKARARWDLSVPF